MKKKRDWTWLIIVVMCISVIFVILYPQPMVDLEALDENYGKDNYTVLTQEYIGSYSLGKLHRITLELKDGNPECEPTYYCDAIDACPQANCTLKEAYIYYEEERLVFIRPDGFDIKQPTTLVSEIQGAGGYWTCDVCTILHSTFSEEKSECVTKKCRHGWQGDVYKERCHDVSHSLNICISGGFTENSTAVVDYNITLVEVFEDYVEYTLAHTFVNPYSQYSGVPDTTLSKMITCISQNNELCWRE